MYNYREPEIKSVIRPSPPLAPLLIIVIRPSQFGGYIDELIDDSGRMVKFWHLCEYLSGEINVHANPAAEEAIAEVGWFAQGELPSGHVFPAILHDAFWQELKSGLHPPENFLCRSPYFSLCGAFRASRISDFPRSHYQIAFKRSAE